MTKKALLLIDIQDGLDQLEFYGGQRNNPDAEINCCRLLQRFRDQNRPIFHVKNNSTNTDSPLHPSNPGNEIKAIVAPIQGEPVIEKQTNSAFIDTELKELIDQQEIKDLVIIGLTTEHCVASTTRMASDLGYQVQVVSDATAAFNKIGIQGERWEAETIHLTSLAALKGEFAEIVDTQTILRES
ncbi:cysteine hydrolase family protein [Reichenbachiella sp.]|uniref:cysteine hydrolase family protein n=1 Tax=Reichenbachiella sp. TaxID=2184521 RepID=UPI003B5CB2A7